MQDDIRPPHMHRRPKQTPRLEHPIPAATPADIEINEDQVESPAANGGHTGRFRHLKNHWKNLNRNLRSAIVGLCLLVLAAGIFGLYYYLVFLPGIPPIHLARVVKAEPKPPPTAASPLTGLQVAPELAKRPVTGIMIENSLSARPQSGLQAAGVVYEAIAEGGITRFLALFQEGQPQYIGPVRSLRPYFIDFAAPFQASIVHVGGSPDALSRVRNGSYRDLDQFFNSGYFSRVGTRAAPHNVYTSFTHLDALNQAKGYSSSQFSSWERKPDKKLATPTAKTIDFSISYRDYYVHYDYDAASNSYLRSEGGAPHIDLVNAADKTGTRLQPKVVIALVMKYGLAADRHHSVYGDTGSGQTYVFQDGGVTAGTWEKTDAGSQIQFKDSAGAPLKLNAGQTWLTLVGSADKISYKP